MSRRCWRGRAGFPTLKNRVDLETEEAVVAYAVEYPAHGQVRVSNELRKRGVFVSPSGVRSIWLRHDLAHFKARLKALEAKAAEEGIILTEAQIQALEKKKLDDEAWGEIGTAHPGHLGSQDTFYAGTLKGDELAPLAPQCECVGLPIGEAGRYKMSVAVHAVACILDMTMSPPESAPAGFPIGGQAAAGSTRRASLMPSMNS